MPEQQLTLAPGVVSAQVKPAHVQSFYVADDTDACLSTCLNAICGDSAIQAGVEECDDACVMVPMRAGPVYSSEP